MDETLQCNFIVDLDETPQWQKMVGKIGAFAFDIKHTITPDQKPEAVNLRKLYYIDGGPATLDDVKENAEYKLAERLYLQSSDSFHPELVDKFKQIYTHIQSHCHKNEDETDISIANDALRELNMIIEESKTLMNLITTEIINKKSIC